MNLTYIHFDNFIKVSKNHKSLKIVKISTFWLPQVVALHYTLVFIALEFNYFLLLCWIKLLNSISFCLLLLLSILLSICSYLLLFLFFIPLIAFLISVAVIILPSAFPSAITSWNFVSNILSVSFSSIFWGGLTFKRSL